MSRWQKRRAIFGTLAVPDHDLQTLEVQVLDAQTEVFLETQSTTVKLHGPQPRELFQMFHDARHLILPKDFGKPLGLLGPDDVVETTDVHFEHVFVEEKDGSQSPVLGERPNITVDCKMRQEHVEIQLPHFQGMSPLVEQNKTTRPNRVRFFGAVTESPGANHIFHSLHNLAPPRFPVGILYADINLSRCVEPKHFHDVIGGYNRFDIFTLTVNRAAQRPISFHPKRHDTNSSNL